MSLTKLLKTVRGETSVSSTFPITHLNTPSVFETKEGLLGTVIGIRGVPFVTEQDETLNALSHTLHQALMRLDEHFIVYMTTHRKEESISLDGAFQSILAKRINDKYHARFKDRSLYKNHLYLTIVLKGDTSDKTAKSIAWLKRLLDIGSSKAKALSREGNLKVLSAVSEQLLASLSKFKPHRLGDKDEDLGYSELLAFLALFPNAGRSLPFQMPERCPAIAKSIPETFLSEEIYPEGHIGQSISAHQILFGQYIQFQGATPKDTRFGAILSIKKYPKITASNILDPLLRLDSEFIATHSFAPITRAAALKIVDLRRSKLIMAEDGGISQIEALSDLEDKLASEEIRLGHHHHTLLLIAPTIKQLEENINQAVKEYDLSGTVVIKETLGEELSFFAQIPGNHSYIARASLITSLNFINFCSLHNMQTGFKDGNHLGSAVTLLETPFKTPVFFNYHGKGSKTNPSSGHTIIIGSTDAGKTTLTSFLDAQMSRYQGRSFYLDRNESSKIYILGSGKSHYTVIDPKYQDKISMNPLQLPDSHENRTFIKTWFSSLILQEGENALPASISGLINECVNYNFDHLAKPYRNLSNLVKILPIHFPRFDELRRWLKRGDDFDKGEYAWLFDNEEDALELGFDKVGFDITYLTDKVKPNISMPVYLYLVHRMQQCLDGRLTTFNIEEAFKVFESPFWSSLLSDWVPTIRKANGHFVFLTQSPETIIKSSLTSAIRDNVATEIYLPNPKANKKTYIEHLNITPAEYAFIQETSPESRLFLYKQKHEAIICKADLSTLPEEIRILSGNTSSVALMDAIIEEVGDNPDIWLPIFVQRSAQ